MLLIATFKVGLLVIWAPEIVLTHDGATEFQWSEQPRGQTTTKYHTISSLYHSFFMESPKIEWTNKQGSYKLAE